MATSSSPRGAVLRRSCAVAAVAAAALFAALGMLRHQPGALQGDEGTYVAMAASLARDGDLRFGGADAAWARARPDRPAALILERTGSGFYYSKPILYPLFAAPAYALGGEVGMVLANLLALGAALWMARAALARRPGGERATGVVALFALGSIVAPYAFWKMTEALQIALATAGLALTLRLFGDESSSAPPARSWHDRSWAIGLGALCLGLLAALREPNALVTAVPVAAALLARRWRRAAALTAVCAATYAMVVALTLLATGAANPYKATRATFNAESGYPGEPSREAGGSAAEARFDRSDELATSSLGPVPLLSLSQSGYAAVYFFVGRHSGLLLYFPAALALLAALGTGVARSGRAALGAFAATALFYLLWWPSNYFGGETQLGNRYLVAAFPCLLFAARALPSWRAIGVAWLVALGVGGSALISVVRTRATDPTSQSHAHAGLFRLLPYESVASNIDGRRDRYWAGDFVRFVDPYARADAWSFELAAGAPAAELELATAWAGTPLRFLVVATDPAAQLVVSDWRSSQRHRLTADGGGRSGGPLLVQLAPAWRHHRFWWRSGRAYAVRLLRIRLEAAPGTTARLRYLGRQQVPESGFEHQLLAAKLPESARPGETLAVAVTVRNRGPWEWSSRATLPVLLAARLVDESGGAAPIEFRGELPRPLPPGGECEVTLALQAPTAPGRYRLTVDLVLEDVAWFAERTGSPLAETTLTVLP